MINFHIADKQFENFVNFLIKKNINFEKFVKGVFVCFQLILCFIPFSFLPIIIIWTVLNLSLLCYQPMKKYDGVIDKKVKEFFKQKQIVFTGKEKNFTYGKIYVLKEDNCVFSIKDDNGEQYNSFMGTDHFYTYKSISDYKTIKIYSFDNVKNFRRNKLIELKRNLKKNEH